MQMGRRDRLYANLMEHFRSLSPLYIFLSAYFFTAVLGNIIYTTPWGQNWPARSIPEFSWSNLPLTFGFEFWALVLLPFILTPLIAVFVGMLSQRSADAAIKFIPEISPTSYLAICVGLYAYAFYSLITAEALTHMLDSADAVRAVHARFALLSALGFKPLMTMKSLLVFMTIYACVRATREGEWFWYIAGILHTIILSACLILLNMKWPVLVFIIALGLCFFLFSRKHALIKTTIAITLGLVVYFLLSVLILRLAPVNGETSEPQNGTSITQGHLDRRGRVDTDTFEDRAMTRDDTFKDRAMTRDYASNVATTGVLRAPYLAVAAINRMAISVPYYFDYSGVSADCPQSIKALWIGRPLSCEPTLLVYASMFGDDGFTGIGTAPAAVHLYAYALDGWTGALIALALASIVLGLFLALWRGAQTNSVYAASFVMGGYTAYFFSQLPIEGPLIYDHGMVWWAFLVLGLSAASSSFSAIHRKMREHRIAA